MNVPSALLAELHASLMDAPALVALLRGPELVAEFANHAFCAALPGRAVLGRSLFDVIPELPALGLDVLARRAFETGLPSAPTEVRWDLDRGRGPEETWFSVEYRPVKEGGREGTVLVFSYDVTSQVLARRAHEALARERAERALVTERALGSELRASEERFRSIVESTSQVVFTTDAQARMGLGAPAWARFTGQSHEETAGIGWLGALHPVDRDRARRLWKEISVSPAQFQFECRVRRRDGSYAEAVARGVPLFDDAGRLREWVGSLQDVTLQRREEFALRLLSSATAQLSGSLEVEATLAAVAQLAVPLLADFCFVDLVDEEGGLQRARVATARPEDAACVDDLLRVSPGAPPAGPLRTALREQRSVLIPSFDQLAELRRGEEGLEALHRLGDASLVAVPLSARGRPLGVMTLVVRSSERRYGALDVALAEEIARRAALALDNAQLYRKTEEANRAKDEFLATVSHELRTPLSAILGWTRLLRGGKLTPEKTARALETLERNARAQGRLVEDLLDVGRIMSGKTRLSVQQVDLVKVAEAALDSVRPSADLKDLHLQAVHRGEALLLGDADRLQQIIWNLLSNAIKFTPRGGQVEVRLESLPEAVELSVRDNGQGIRPDFLPYVFERFRQADASSTRTHGGLGLGLAIVRHLVELHGGRISAASRGEGLGATFTLHLPLGTSA